VGLPPWDGMRGKKTKAKALKPLFAPIVRSMKRAREVTSAFHAHTRTLSDGAASAHAKAAALEALDELGGRQAYQEASVLTTTRHRTSKWTFAMLTKRGMRPKKGERALRALEVGAINTDLMSAKWLDVRAIDIKSQHPKIVQRDFFDEVVKEGAYDVVHSSMVLNCVPTAAQRGEMLARTAKMLRVGGVFFLYIPVRCVKAMTHETLVRFLRAVGLRVVEHKATPKVMFYCAEKVDPKTAASTQDKVEKCKAREEFVLRTSAQTLASKDTDAFSVALEQRHMCGF
jgi:25S rRNA (adenine2142-N1)-methyltransferase